jgi:Protein of unknown function (DUF2891)
MLPGRLQRHRSHLLATVVAMALLVCEGQQSLAQQPTRADTIPLRADYRDLAELLQKLPNVAAPGFDESRALWLGALPLACLDRLQSRPGRGGPGAGGRANSPVDTLRSPSTVDTAERGGVGRGAGLGATAPGGPAANSGAGYFWVPTYTLTRDHDRLRAFWGCNDWHSAVGSTWVTIRVLKSFPKSVLGELTREKLNAHLGRSNLDGELAFFYATAAAINPIPSANQGGLFERPYGFAWLLELQTDLRTWPDTQAKRWATNVAPLAAWMADSLGAYFMKLVEPVRVGTQNNTAQSMTLALDYADVARDTKLRGAVVSAARKLYLADTTCATQLERVIPTAGGRGGRGGRGAGRGANADTTARALTTPNDLTAAAGRGAAPPAGGGGGPEIFSPCLSEAALMARVLESHAYLAWVDRFLPPLQSGRFAPLTEAIGIPISAPAAPGRGGGPTDTSAAAIAAAASAAASALATERARLAGLSFSRAQSMERIARALPPTDPRVIAWHRLSAIQADRGFELMRDDRAGSYWLPAQALLYLTLRKS